MSADDEGVITSDADADVATVEPTDGEQQKMDLSVEIQDIGPCRKHVVVTVSEDDIVQARSEAVDELSESAEVPGFRIGRVPKALLQKRFREEISGQVKQKVLLQSLEQLSDDNSIDPINQPDIDVDSLDIPDEGDFRYEFDVEVRPEFDIPDYKGFTIDRPSGDISDDEFTAFRQQFLESYATREGVERAAEAGDFVTCDLTFTHNDKPIRESEDVALQLRPTLRFQDSALDGFDELLAGSSAGDTVETKVTISVQSSVVEMRGEEVDLAIQVKEVQQQVLPQLDKEFLDRLDCEDVEGLDEQIKASLERQIEFNQRQSARTQVLEKITDSATWDLPESLVEQQTENALRREMLEMSQAGFTREQISARENQIRQSAIDNTRQALKEHFVLDRIASNEDIECDESDIDHELMMMAFQSGEPLRRVRARMVKSGMMDNLEAQLRERKAIDFILEHASFNDVEREPLAENSVATAQFAICGNMTTTLVDDATEADAAE